MKTKYEGGQKPRAGDVVMIFEATPTLELGVEYTVERVLAGTYVYLTIGGGEYWPSRFKLVRRK